MFGIEVTQIRNNEFLISYRKGKTIFSEREVNVALKPSIYEEKEIILVEGMNLRNWHLRFETADEGEAIYRIGEILKIKSLIEIDLKNLV